jgi:hypothetical protein
MTPVTHDFDDLLRRALHAEVDSIEPAEGGLDRIRRRTRAPWLVRQVSLMLTECVDLVRLIGIRLEPWFTATVGARFGAWAASVRRLVAPRRTGAHGSDSSHLAWLRPALAVGAAVVIVVAGVYGLAQVRDNLVLELFPSNSSPTSPAPGPDSTGGGQGSTLNQGSAPGIIPPGSTHSASPSPKASCSSSPKQQQAAPTSSPSLGASSSATPTPDPSPSTPPPSPTVSPTPTDTGSGATTTGDGSQPTAATVDAHAVANTATTSSSTPCGG